MFRRRVTIASLLAVIVFFGVVFAGLRSGTAMWMRSIYTGTFLTLVYAALAAKYRGAFWYGFSVAGWAYLVLGISPWGEPSSFEGINGGLISSWFYGLAIDFLSNWHAGRPGSMGPYLWETNCLVICHCALTVLLAVAGGLLSAGMARSRPQGTGAVSPVG